TIIHFRNDWESGFAMAGSIKSVQSIERRLTAEKKDRNYPSGTLQATKNDHSAKTWRSLRNRSPDAGRSPGSIANRKIRKLHIPNSEWDARPGLPGSHD